MTHVKLFPPQAFQNGNIFLNKCLLYCLQSEPIYVPVKYEEKSASGTESDDSVCA